MKERRGRSCWQTSYQYALTLLGVIPCRCQHSTPSKSVVCYNITGFEDTKEAIIVEDTKGTIIIVDVFNIIQKIPHTGIHLKVDEEQGRVAQESKRQGYSDI